MQLNLQLFDKNDVPQRASAAWEDLEEAARIAATEALCAPDRSHAAGPASDGGER